MLSSVFVRYRSVRSEDSKNWITNKKNNSILLNWVNKHKKMVKSIICTEFPALSALSLGAGTGNGSNFSSAQLFSQCAHCQTSTRALETIAWHLMLSGGKEYHKQQTKTVARKCESHSSLEIPR